MYQHARRKSKGCDTHGERQYDTGIEHFHEGNIGLHVESSPPTTHGLWTRPPRSRLRVLHTSEYKAIMLKMSHNKNTRHN